MSVAESAGAVADGPLVSVVMPCLNEEAAIGACIEKIHRTFAAAQIDGEIVVCDNGSTDRSVAIAESLGARVVHQPLRGYGRAYLKGFDEARGRYLVMGDADDTYDFSVIPKFVQLLETGHDFVTGQQSAELQATKSFDSWPGFGVMSPNALGRMAKIGW